MKLRHIYIPALALAGALVLTSCEKDFLNVNENPNQTTDANVELVLPAAQVYAAYNLGSEFNIVGNIFAQYYTQGEAASQYREYEQYRLSNTDFQRPWTSTYSGPLNDLRIIINKSMAIVNNTQATDEDRERASQYAGIALLMRAYIFQNLTDQYGDIPLTNANKGLAADGAVLNPSYDTQATVYDSIAAMAKRGVALIDPNAATHPGSDDLVYGGDMSLWEHFGNTLQLRIFLRQIKARPGVAEAGIRALQDADFIGPGETAQVTFNETTLNRNPFFLSLFSLGRGNLVGSNTILNYYRDNADPRVETVFVPASTGALSGQYVGLPQGEGGLPAAANTRAESQFALPSPFVGGRPDGSEDDITGANAPVIFIGDYESAFLQAEAYARGLLTGGTAAAAYEEGVTSSFEYLGKADSATSYLARPNIAYNAGAGVEDQVKQIITQKWVAMAGLQGLEAWTEYRRTNYPDFLTVSVAAQAGSGAKPTRLPYPDTEASRNSSFPGFKDIFQKLFYDVD